MDIKSLMKQAQQMQEKMKILETELANSEYEGTAGGGMVRIIISGSHVAKKISIDKSLIKADESEILEDLIIAGFNDAKKKIDESSGSAIKAATAGIPLPAGFKF